MEIKTVSVIGGGLMGRQIALNNAKYGFVSYLTDVSEDVSANQEPGLRNIWQAVSPRVV